MNKKLLPVIFVLLASVCSAQNDLRKIQSVIPVNIKSETIRTNELNDDIEKMNVLLTKLESDLRSIDAQIDKMKDHRDSLSELGEEQQLKMQLLMERMTKADSAASNMFKKFTEIAGQIIRNFK